MGRHQHQWSDAQESGETTVWTCLTCPETITQHKDDGSLGDYLLGAED